MKHVKISLFALAFVFAAGAAFATNDPSDPCDLTNPRSSCDGIENDCCTVQKTVGDYTQGQILAGQFIH